MTFRLNETVIYEITSIRDTPFQREKINLLTRYFNIIYSWIDENVNSMNKINDICIFLIMKAKRANPRRKYIIATLFANVSVLNFIVWKTMYLWYRC